jgi:hypothetical protein
MKGWIGMRRDKLSNIFLWIMFIITFPFLFVYVAGTELFKKAIYVIAVIFAGWFGLFLFTTGLIAVLGDWKNALNQAVDLAINIKGAILIEIPQKMPIWTKEVVNYLYAHPFVRNLLIMWLIGFLIQQFFGLLGRYSYSAYTYRVRKMSSNQQNEPPQEVDPTDGFTKARFDAYFPEGWQERRQNFFNQVKEAREEIHKKEQKRNEKGGGNG